MAAVECDGQATAAVRPRQPHDMGGATGGEWQVRVAGQRSQRTRREPARLVVPAAFPLGGDSGGFRLLPRGHRASPRWRREWHRIVAIPEHAGSTTRCFCVVPVRNPLHPVLSRRRHRRGTHARPGGHRASDATRRGDANLFEE
eukprot:ctg_810.g213